MTSSSSVGLQASVQRHWSEMTHQPHDTRAQRLGQGIFIAPWWLPTVYPSVVFASADTQEVLIGFWFNYHQNMYLCRPKVKGQGRWEVRKQSFAVSTEWTEVQLVSTQGSILFGLNSRNNQRTKVSVGSFCSWSGDITFILLFLYDWRKQRL